MIDLTNELPFVLLRGSSLAKRIRRLVANPTRRDSLSARAVMVMMLAAVMVTGAIRIDLVEVPAQAQEIEHIEREVPPEFGKQLSEFANQINTSGNSLLEKFKEALQSGTGELVAADRMGWIEERLRDQARDRAIPEFLDKHFSQDANARDTEFAKAFVDACQGYNEDIGLIRKTLAEVATRVVEDSEENKLLKRFLEHEASAPILYFRELRSQLRPDAMSIAQRLDEFFVPIGSEFHVRAGSQERADEILKQLETALLVSDRIKEDIVDFSRELADSDELTVRLKQAMRGSALRSIVAFDIVGDEEAAVNERIDELFEQLEHVVVDTADGLVVRSEQQEEVEEILEKANRIERNAKRLRKPVRQFAERIAMKDDTHQRLKKFFESELAVMRIGDDYEISAVTPEEAVKALISEGLETEPDGRVRLRSDISQEFVEHAREMLREFRTLKRKTRPIADFALGVADPQLRGALKSNAGKMAIARAIQQEFAGRHFAGLGVWVKEHFDQTPKGYVVRDGHEEEIREFLSQVDEVAEELENDDF